MGKLNGYSLSRKWWDFAFEHSDCKSYHSALYFWIIELNNRLGWKLEFGLPTSAAMEGLSIGNKNTYLNTLRDIEKWGFIKIVKEAKNQYQSCRVQLCHSESDTAQDMALDTALIQQSDGTGNSIDPGTDTIDKQVNKQTSKPRKPRNKKKGFIPPSLDDVKNYFSENGYTEEAAVKAFKFYNDENWHDSKGNKVLSWKQKMQSVWFKPESLISAKPKPALTKDLTGSEAFKQRKQRKERSKVEVQSTILAG